MFGNSEWGKAMIRCQEIYVEGIKVLSAEVGFYAGDEVKDPKKERLIIAEHAVNILNAIRDEYSSQDFHEMRIVRSHFRLRGKRRRCISEEYLNEDFIDDEDWDEDLVDFFMEEINKQLSKNKFHRNAEKYHTHRVHMFAGVTHSQNCEGKPTGSSLLRPSAGVSENRKRARDDESAQRTKTGSTLLRPSAGVSENRKRTRDDESAQRTSHLLVRYRGRSQMALSSINRGAGAPRSQNSAPRSQNSAGMPSGLSSLRPSSAVIQNGKLPYPIFVRYRGRRTDL
jgi:hypothetical protein